MSFEKTLLLGAIAGLTIFLGLPLARVRAIGPRARGALAIFSAGILAFLLVDVAGGAMGTVDDALAAAHGGQGSWARFAGLLAMLVVGFAGGLVALGAVEGRWLRRLPPMAGGSDAAALPRPAALAAPARAGAAADPLRLGMLIAAAIGLHNFSEGLAIGVSSQAGEIGLATTLIIGFALHNTTEGFAIVGPLGGSRPSWAWLALAGLIAGGPTVLGTAIGYSVSSAPLELAFLALAAGAILYVVLEIWSGARRRVAPALATAVLAAGFLLAYGTELVVVYSGA